MERQKQIDRVNSWLKDISKALGTTIELDDHGTCTFQAEDHIIAIEVSYDYPMVHLYSPLIPLPDDKNIAASFLARALELNAFQVITRGGAIATPPGGGLLIYCYSMPIDNTDSEKFSQILGSFYETVPELKQLLTSFPAEDMGQSQGKNRNPGIKI